MTIGTGTLTLTGGVTAVSSNAGTVASITTDAGDARSWNGTSLTFNVGPVTINGNMTVANITPSLNLNGLVGSSSNNATYWHAIKTG